MGSQQYHQRKGLLLLAGIIPFLIGFAAAGPAPTGADLLNAGSFMEHIRFLASDELGGRGNGSDGLEKAAAYISQRFREIGLVPAGEGGSYFQTFTVTLDGDLGPKNRMSLELGDEEKLLRLHKDYEPMTFTGIGRADAPVVFVGYGITAPEHEYDDYAGIDVEGKAVLLLRHVPREERSDGPFDPDRGHATFVSKVVNAKTHGAHAVLLANDPRGGSDRLLKFGDDLGAEDLDIPVVHIKRDVARKLLEASGKDLASVQQSIDDELQPDSFELAESKLRLEVDVTRSRAEVRNVLGYLPPADAEGNNELILIGGHYDHVGRDDRNSRASRNNRGKIHNGADDNASGTAGVIELARVLSTRDDLERGILFAAFAGEELGLQGSSTFTRKPTVPLENIVAMLNLDMIGRLRDDKLYMGGVGTSPLFRTKLDELGRAENMELTYSFSGYGASDHMSFTLKAIPSLFFFTGLHKDYHRPSDDWDEINQEGAERVLRLAYQMADYIQSLPERPAFSKPEKEEKRGRVKD